MFASAVWCWVAAAVIHSMQNMMAIQHGFCCWQTHTSDDAPVTLGYCLQHTNNVNDGINCLSCMLSYKSFTAATLLYSSKHEGMTAAPSVVTPPAGSAAPGTAGKAQTSLLLAVHAEVAPTPYSHNSCCACFCHADAQEASPAHTH